MIPPPILRLCGACCLLAVMTVASASSRTNTNTNTKNDLNHLNYKVYPRLSADSSAVIEWGHSAIISALDGSVAQFGPQTSQAALLEVECQPILADPMNGVMVDSDSGDGNGDSLLLRNAKEVHGNMVVMTNQNQLTGVEMAKIAKHSGAVALLVINVDQDRPDEIYSLPSNNDDDFETDIPVVMISLHSANVLTSATITPDMAQEDVVNHGMPERVRLYAGGDRPFFEDIPLPEPDMEQQQQQPTASAPPALYLIHNLLTQAECESLVAQTTNKLTPVSSTQPSHDMLQFLSHHATQQAQHVDRVLLWKGALQTHAQKQVNERIEQVTEFSAAHFSDFMVERYDTTTQHTSSHWGHHYDAHATFAESGNPIAATVTVFLSDDHAGPSVVFPDASSNSDQQQPIQVQARQGLAIVQHHGELPSEAAIHAFLAGSSGGYVARKHIFVHPVPAARRVVLPLLALPFGGKLPSFLVTLHNGCIDQFGETDGGTYFNKIIVGLCVLVVASLAQVIATYVQDQMKPTTTTNNRSSSSTSKKEKSSLTQNTKKKQTSGGPTSSDTTTTSTTSSEAKKKRSKKAKSS